MIEIDTIEIENCTKVLEEIKRLTVAYRFLFCTPPVAIAVSPQEWFQIKFGTVRYTLESPTPFSNTIVVDGVPIVCKLNGPPEIIASPEHAANIEYMKQTNDKRLLPLLTGA